MKRPAGSLADRAWIAYLALAVAASSVYLFVPGLRGNGPLLNLISASSFIAILVGIRIHRPAAAWPWRWFAIGQALFFLGDVYTYSYPLVSHREVHTSRRIRVVFDWLSEGLAQPIGVVRSE